jgi:hypothetical protein
MRAAAGANQDVPAGNAAGPSKTMATEHQAGWVTG